MRATVLATVLLIALRLAAICRLIQSGRQRRATLLILVTTAVLVRTSTQISPNARQSRLHRLLRLPFGLAAHWTPRSIRLSRSTNFGLWCLSHRQHHLVPGSRRLRLLEALLLRRLVRTDFILKRLEIRGEGIQSGMRLTDLAI